MSVYAVVVVGVVAAFLFVFKNKIQKQKFKLTVFALQAIEYSGARCLQSGVLFDDQDKKYQQNYH